MDIQKINLEFTSLYVDNKAHNVIPSSAKTQFNIRYNNLQTASKLKRKIIKKITKVNPVFSTTGGTSDARFIKKIAPCLEFALVNKTMHKVDECVSLKDLSNLKKIYYNFLLEFFK